MGSADTLRTLLSRLWPFSQTVALSHEDEAAHEILRKKVLKRCTHFRRLLSSNKTALEVMADIEDRLAPITQAGTRPFGMHYIRSCSARVVTAVFQMIQSLNALSNNNFADLKPVFGRITRAMETAARTKSKRIHGPYVMPLTMVRAKDMPLVGGKMGNLGDIASQVTVPDGFVITTSAYYTFMEINGLKDAIDQRIQETDMDDLEEVFALSSVIQQRIAMARVPEEIQQAIQEAVDALVTRYGEDVRLALRSSAVGEDALHASFAGQFHTELHVHPEESLDVWREIIASKYSVTAMSYRYAKGIPEDAVPMSVGVLTMVDAKAGGVAYSHNPTALQSLPINAHALQSVRQGCVVVNAVQGLPKAVVDGAFSPDTYILTRSRSPQLVGAHIPYKPWYYGYDPHKGSQRYILNQEEGTKPCLSEPLAQQVAHIALMLEEYYGQPQDVEWALTTTPEGQNEIIVLQSRPLKIEDAHEQQADSLPLETTQHIENISEEQQDMALPPPLAQGGMGVSMGVGLGPVHIVHKDVDLLSFPQGGVLVVSRAMPQWAMVLSRASAVIAEAGGTAGHLAAVAREFGIPAVFGLTDAQHLLAGVENVTVDAHTCRIYEGLHPHIRPAQSMVNTLVDSPVYIILQALAPLVVPLHLLDPASPEFAPQNCKSLHDITRFCHEKAVGLMFPQDMGEAASYAKQLKVGKKLQYWILDMDKGFKEPVRTATVELGQIQCKPMLALWDGMTHIPWDGPPAISGGAFLSLMMESTMNKDLEASTATVMAQKNFLIIDEHYLNMQARFGYHFCTIDAHIRHAAYENYVSFQFKGGAAVAECRCARARMVANVLEAQGFTCDVRQDALFAIAEAYDQEKSLRAMRILGHVLIHTRQVDVVMNNREVAAAMEAKLLADCGAL